MGGFSIRSANQRFMREDGSFPDVDDRLESEFEGDIERIVSMAAGACGSLRPVRAVVARDGNDCRHALSDEVDDIGMRRPEHSGLPGLAAAVSASGMPKPLYRPI